MSAISEIPSYYSPAPVPITTKSWTGIGSTVSVQTVSTRTEFADSLGGPTGLSEEIAIVYYTQVVRYIGNDPTQGPPVESSATALETGTAFTTVETSSTTTGTSAASPYPSADGAGPIISTEQDQAHSNASPNVGAVAGGVVGAVIAVAAIAAIVFFLMRRKRRQMRPQLPEMQRYPARDRRASSEMERVL